MPRLDRLPQISRNSLLMLPVQSNDTAPFTRPTRPLSACRLAIVTTAGLHRRDDRPFGPADQTYRLDYAPQPLVNPDRVRLRVSAAAGWVTTGATGWRRTAKGASGAFEPSADEEFTLEVTPN